MQNVPSDDQALKQDQEFVSRTLLSATFLEALVAEFDTDQVKGILLGGSHVRGDATPYSDVDLACFVPDSFQPLRKRFRYYEGQLISIGLKTLKGVQQQLSDPYQALWIVPSFRQARILLDKDGSMQQLKQMVEDFVWEPLHQEAMGYAGHILTCDVELIHKLLGNIWKGNAAGVAYTTSRLFDDATKVMALSLPVFITTDSLYYQEVEASVGMDTAWTYYHRLLTGTTSSVEDSSSVQASSQSSLKFVGSLAPARGATTFLTQNLSGLTTRGRLALQLYRETAQFLWPSLNEERRLVVEKVLGLIEQTVIDNSFHEYSP